MQIFFLFLKKKNHSSTTLFLISLHQPVAGVIDADLFAPPPEQALLPLLRVDALVPQVVPELPDAVESDAVSAADLDGVPATVPQHDQAANYGESFSTR